eukprot:303093-Prorocentrum_lima.AAC.1
MHYKTRDTPGELESLFNHERQELIESKEKSIIQEEQGLEHTSSSILGALIWIGFWTRPDKC